jgi:hypothetical protein
MEIKEFAKKFITDQPAAVMVVVFLLLIALANYLKHILFLEERFDWLLKEGCILGPQTITAKAWFFGCSLALVFT